MFRNPQHNHVEARRLIREMRVLREADAMLMFQMQAQSARMTQLERETRDEQKPEARRDR